MCPVLLTIFSSMYAGFANPPTNFQCKVKFSDINYPWPRLEMQWQNPDFIAFGEVNRFRIYSSFPGVDVNEARQGYRFEIELDGIDDRETMEGVFELSVTTDAPSGANGDYRSAPARCDFNTVDRGMYIVLTHMCTCMLIHSLPSGIIALIPALNPPLPLDVRCANSPDQNATIRWTNPLATDGLNVNIQLIELKATCLYGNHSLYGVGCHTQQ